MRSRPGKTPHVGTSEFDLGKRSIALDLKAPSGVQSMRRLCESADVLIEPYRPGVMERLGLGPEVLLADNPRLVYARLTGWGQSGAYSQTAGHDINYIAISGALSMFSRPGERPLPPVNLLGDFAGGALSCAFGVTLALLERQQSGRGQVVDAAMLDSAAYFTTFMHRLRAIGGWSDAPGTNMLDGAAPFYRTYRCKDGSFVAVGAIEPEFWQQLLEKLVVQGNEPLLQMAQMDQRRWPEMSARLAALFAERTRDEWAAHFAGSDACVSPVLSLAEAPSDVHNASRGIFASDGPGGGAWVEAPPVLSRTPARRAREATRACDGESIDVEHVLEAWSKRSRL